MAVLKFSQIPPAAPAIPSDQIVGVKSGTIDALYSILQVLGFTFTATTPGTVPASGGGVTAFLRADGGWVVPPTGGPGGTRLQRSIVNSGALPILASDSILNFNATADLVAVVPAYGTLAGLPLTFKNLRGAHVQTLIPTGGDTFDGFTSYLLQPGTSVTLMPFNDGVNTGYAIE